MKIIEREALRIEENTKYLIEHEGETYTVYHHRLEDNEFSAYESEYDITDSKGNEITDEEIEDEIINVINEPTP